MWGNKYKAKRTGDFPSKLEYAVHEILLLRQRAGKINDIKRQQKVILQDGGRDTNISWRVDFSFEENGETVYAEAKGIETGEYRLKLKLWRKNPPADLEIYKGSWSNPVLIERIKKNETR